MILTEDEIQVLKSMAIYWKEVRGRDDQTPLLQEARTIAEILGVRLLEVVEGYMASKDAAADMLKALKALVDDEPCRFDHHGYCQTHNLNDPCEQKLGRAAIAKAEPKGSD